MLALEDMMDFHQLRQQGISLRAISRHTGHNRQTITKYLKSGLKEPGYKPRAPRPGKLDPYRNYLVGRLNDLSLPIVAIDTGRIRTIITGKITLGCSRPEYIKDTIHNFSVVLALGTAKIGRKDLLHKCHSSSVMSYRSLTLKPQFNICM